MSCIDFGPTVVIDAGSDTYKAGFAGHQDPSIELALESAYLKQQDVKCDGFHTTKYCGNSGDAKRSGLSIKNAVRHSEYVNCEKMGEIWHNIFYNNFKIDPKDYPVLITDIPFINNRKKMMEIMFESFNVPYFYVGMQAKLALYGAGRTSGLALDIGNSLSYTIPIYHDYVQMLGVELLEIAGQDLTDVLTKLISDRSMNVYDSSNKAVVRDIKEKFCYVPLNFDKENIIETSLIQRSFELPDGSFINIDKERFSVPEILLRPKLIGSEAPGIHYAIHKSVEKCDVNIRKYLYKNIVLSGGCTMFPGITDRLICELANLVPQTTKVKIIAHSNRKYLSWIGGSVLASLSSFPKICISNEEYREGGINLAVKLSVN